jgi:hypothetical protein
MDPENEYRIFVLKFKPGFADHKAKRTDKLIVGMRKYLPLLKEAVMAVWEARSEAQPEGCKEWALPGLTRFCGHLQDRVSDREAREAARANGKGKKREREKDE